MSKVVLSKTNLLPHKTSLFSFQPKLAPLKHKNNFYLNLLLNSVLDKFRKVTHCHTKVLNVEVPFLCSKKKENNRVIHKRARLLNSQQQLPKKLEHLNLLNMQHSN